MLSRCALTLAARCRNSTCGGATITRSVVVVASNPHPYYYQPNCRMMTTVRDAATADDALRFSGYSEIDFTVPEDAPVYDAVQKFAAFNIGCLVTVDTAGTLFRYCSSLLLFFGGKLDDRDECHSYKILLLPTGKQVV